jgi:two-component system sensor histidine kinase BaeS
VVTVNTHDELQELAEGFNSISEELSLYQHRQKQWLMDVSHELKTPLTVLVAEVFAISDDLTKCDENTAELLQKEALRIKRIADDLYQLCQIDEMGIQLKIAPLRLPSLIKEQVISYHSRFDAKQIAVTEAYLADSPLVLADADRLAQVIGNLFENCLRYVQAPGKVWVREEIVPDGVLIVVEDSGPGVPPEFLSRLFDRLYRVESAGSGAGLGLAICKEIVQAHDGRITAKQSSHGGLRIEILLPRYENSV